MASLNIATSLEKYFSEIKSKSDIEKLKQIDLSDIVGEEFSFEQVGLPSIERLVNLNVGYKNILNPTTSFNENNSYFSYKNTRTSSDLALINQFQKENYKRISIDKNFEGIRIAAVGIPDGLINNLRISSNRTSSHSIIELSLLSLNHKSANSENRFTCRYKFIFNTCLHVNTVNPDIDLFSQIENPDFLISNILNIDDRKSFEDISINEKDLISFNFGKIKNKSFSIDTQRSFDDAILFNTENYKIKSLPDPQGRPEYILNNNMSSKIIKNHFINYVLKKQFEIFSGASMDESSFPFVGTGRIENTSQESQTLVNFFNSQQYSDDLKDYLSRTAKTSSIINPENFLFSSLNISKFERVFFLPCFRSKSNLDFISADNNTLNVEDQFSFESLIPVVRLL